MKLRFCKYLYKSSWIFQDGDCFQLRRWLSLRVLSQISTTAPGGRSTWNLSRDGTKRFEARPGSYFNQPILRDFINNLQSILVYCVFTQPSSWPSNYGLGLGLWTWTPLLHFGHKDWPWRLETLPIFNQRQKPTEDFVFNIAMSGQFRTLTMFSSIHQCYIRQQVSTFFAGLLVLSDTALAPCNFLPHAWEDW